MDPGIATLLGALGAAAIAVFGGVWVRQINAHAKDRAAERQKQEATKAARERAAQEAAGQLGEWQYRLEGMDARVYERMQAEIEDLRRDLDTVQDRITEERREREAERRASQVERDSMSRRIASLVGLVYQLRYMLINLGVDEASLPRETDL